MDERYDDRAGWEDEDRAGGFDEPGEAVVQQEELVARVGDGVLVAPACQGVTHVAALIDGEPVDPVLQAAELLLRRSRTGIGQARNAALLHPGSGMIGQSHGLSRRAGAPGHFLETDFKPAASQIMRTVTGRRRGFPSIRSEQRRPHRVDGRPHRFRRRR